MMLIAETRPRSRGGVTDWRKVVVLITHRIGPTPSRKKLNPASHGDGMTVVSAITPAATKPVTGPSPITAPNGIRRITRVASSAPTTMPTPYIASVVPTPVADNPR
jgi:hypothetical protein